MKKILVAVIITMLLLIPFSCFAGGDELGVYDFPNAVAPGQKFRVEYVNLNEGENVTVEFYPLLSQLLPFQYTADEYHGKKYGNVSRLITISLSLSSSWSVTPGSMNLKNAGNKFNITVALSYAGYWDMLLVFKYQNGTEDYMIHSLPRVVKKIESEPLIAWLSLYFGAIFVLIFLAVPLYEQRKIKNLKEHRKP